MINIFYIVKVYKYKQFLTYKVKRCKIMQVQPKPQTNPIILNKQSVVTVL